MREQAFYYSLCKEMEYLPDLSASSRGDLYRAFVSELENHIGESDPPISGLQAQALRDALSQAIERIEQEFAWAREHSPTGYPEWVRHPSLQENVTGANDRGENNDKHGDAGDSAGSAVASGDVARTQAPADEPETHRQGGDDPAAASPAGGGMGGGAVHSGGGGPTPFMQAEWPAEMPVSLPWWKGGLERLRIIGLVLNRYVRASASSDSLAYFWLIMEPVFQVLLLVSIYWFAGHQNILGMPILPFAFIGIGSWLMVRTMFMRITTGLGREWIVVFFPPVQRLDVLLARGLYYALSYLLVIIAALGLYAWFVQPLNLDRPLLAFLYFVEVWFLGMGTALSFGYLFAKMPTLRRSMLVLLRAMFLVSGAFFVTEQFPDDWKGLFLWNPFLHGLQLIRSAFFLEYETTDASPLYLFVMTMLIFTFGLVCEQAMKKRPLSPT